ncbi:hypothetical protein DLREEDagr8_12220 [Dongia sp. agr-C8]
MIRTPLPKPAPIAGREKLPVDEPIVVRKGREVGRSSQLPFAGSGNGRGPRDPRAPAALVFRRREARLHLRRKGVRAHRARYALWGQEEEWFNSGQKTFDDIQTPPC